MRSGVYIFIALFAVCAFAIAADGCSRQSSGEARQEEAVENAVSRAQDMHGNPSVQNFKEYDWASTIMELRDRGVSTFTYTEDMIGRKHFMCESLGYGMPYGVQLANPQQIEKSYHNDPVREQAEVNGLYMPRNVAATWILCSCGSEQRSCPAGFSDLGFYPHYSEPTLHVTPVELNPARVDVIGPEEQLTMDPDEF